MLIKSIENAQSADCSVKDQYTQTCLNRYEQSATQLLNELFDLETEQNNQRLDSLVSTPSIYNFLINLTEQLEAKFDNPELTIEQLATSLAVSERQLYRRFKVLLKTTPGKFLRAYRLEKAFGLIRQGEALGNVAFMVGFSSHSYFSRCFKNKYGMVPSVYFKSLGESSLAEM